MGAAQLQLRPLAGLPLPEDGPDKEAFLTGTGSLFGSAAGVAAGVALGAVKGKVGRPSGGSETFAAAFALAMLVGNGPMTVLGVTDPRSWSRTDWAADVVPHLAYAVVAAAAFEAFPTERRGAAVVVPTVRSPPRR